MRITVRVRPGSSRTAVGGRYGDAGDASAALVVAVTQRAVDGAATAAVLAAVARAFGARTRDVHLVTGERSRTKVLELDPVPPGAPERLADLLGLGTSVGRIVGRSTPDPDTERP